MRRTSTSQGREKEKGKKTRSKGGKKKNTRGKRYAARKKKEKKKKTKGGGASLLGVSFRCGGVKASVKEKENPAEKAVAGERKTQGAKKNDLRTHID